MALEGNKIEWPKESTLGFFRRYDGPYDYETVSIGNLPLRRILERHFEFMSRNLHFISAFGRYLLGEKRMDDIIKAEGAAKKTITNAVAAIERKIKQGEEVMKANGIQDDALYGKIETIKLPITTPGARLYARLLTLSDRFYNINSKLWLQGLIDDKAKFDNESTVRNEIKKVIAGVASQFGYILNKTRAQDPEKASLAGDHDEAQLVRDATSAVDAAGAEGTSTVTASSASAEKPAASNEQTGTGRSKRTTKKPEIEPAAAAA